MLKLVLVCTFISLAIAKPGYLESAPISVPEEIYQAAPYPVVQEAYSAPIALPAAQVAPVAYSRPLLAAPVAVAKQVVIPEPQDVSYSRTDVISRKVTASAANAAYIGGGPVEGILQNAVPHAVKNIHYAEENIQSAPHGSRQTEHDYGVEGGLRNIQIDIPHAPEVEVRSRLINAAPPPHPGPPTARAGPPTPPPGPPGPPPGPPAPPPGPPEQPSAALRSLPPPQFQPQPQPLPQPMPQQQVAPQFRQIARIQGLAPSPQYIPSPTPVEFPAPQLRTIVEPAPVHERQTAQLRSSFIPQLPAPQITAINRAYIAPAITKVHTPAVALAAAPAHLAYPLPAPAHLAYSAPIAPITKSYLTAAPAPVPVAYAQGPILQKSVSYAAPVLTKIEHGPGAVSRYY